MEHENLNNQETAQLGIGVVNNWRYFGKDGMPENGRKVELQYIDGSCEEITWQSRTYNPHVEDIPNKWRYACC